MFHVFCIFLFHLSCNTARIVRFSSVTWSVIIRSRQIQGMELHALLRSDTTCNSKRSQSTLYWSLRQLTRVYTRCSWLHGCRTGPYAWRTNCHAPLIDCWAPQTEFHKPQTNCCEPGIDHLIRFLDTRLLENQEKLLPRTRMTINFFTIPNDIAKQYSGCWLENELYLYEYQLWVGPLTCASKYNLFFI